MIILGIETSCDETALALIETRDQVNGRRDLGQNLEYRVIQSLVHSQAELHSAYGGVFPTLAKREHSKNLVPLLKKLLDESDISTKKADSTTFKKILETFNKDLADKNSDLLESINGAGFLANIPNIDVIAVTEGPGLEPALWVGINFARIIGTLWNIPVLPINHMEGHIVGSLLQSDKPYGTWQTLKTLPLPAVALLISGGHTELVKTEGTAADADDTSGQPYKYTILGQTKDDAVGEAFDKVARLLELPYPGGPHVSKLAYEAREKNIVSPIKLPRPMLKSDDCDFSFSGLKTAVLYAFKKAPKENLADFKAGLAREFEDSVAETLDGKLRRAIDEQDVKAIIVGGGVSANRLLRDTFGKTAQEYNIPIFLPDHHVSGDNALMIALVAAMNHGSQKNTSPKTTHTLRADGTKSLI